MWQVITGPLQALVFIFAERCRMIDGYDVSQRLRGLGMSFVIERLDDRGGVATRNDGVAPSQLRDAGHLLVPTEIVI